MDFASIGDLIGFLERERGGDNYLYRGQLVRWPQHRWKWKAEQPPYEIEALYPADFRFFYQESGPTESTTRMVAAARAYGRRIRGEFSTFLLPQLLKIGGQDPWAAGMLSSAGTVVSGKTPVRESAFFRTAWSLAQHYFLATALTDLTFSARVAAWFATNPWDAKAPGPPAGTQGVIYCFNRSGIEEVLRATRIVNEKVLHAGENAEEFFLTDIRDIPPTFARRPTAQAGASVFGFDQPVALQLLFASGAAEIFTFTHQEQQHVGLERTDVIPEDDPFLPIMESIAQVLQALRPTAAGENTINPGDIAADEALDRVGKVMGLPLTHAHFHSRIEVSDRLVGLLFHQIESRGEIRYKYLLAVFDKSNRAIGCALAVEPMQVPEGLARILAQVPQLGGTELLGLWSGSGRSAVDTGSWPTIGDFEARALPIARQVLGI
jgi:hypothetical protein